MLDFLNIPILINHYLILSSLIFFFGMIGIFLNRKNVINILMSIELILLNYTNHPLKTLTSFTSMEPLFLK